MINNITYLEITYSFDCDSISEFAKYFQWNKCSIPSYLFWPEYKWSTDKLTIHFEMYINIQD